MTVLNVDGAKLRREASLVARKRCGLLVDRAGACHAMEALQAAQNRRAGKQINRVSQMGPTDR